MPTDSESNHYTSDEEPLAGAITTKAIQSDGKATSGYKLRNVLKPGRTTQHTTRALFEQIMQGDIELNPDYQRDVVWSDSKQIRLIDSIYRNFYIPPIIFSVQSEEDGTERRVCIDGKQRLTSIKRFFLGEYILDSSFTKEKLWFLESDKDPKRVILSPAYKNLFQTKQIVCVEYSELPAYLEREVFQRVQLGVALNTAERLQAITGPWPDLAREMISKYMISDDGLGANLDLDRTRSRDYQNMCHALFSVTHLPSLMQATPLQLEKWLNKNDGPTVQLRERVVKTFRVYCDIARDKKLKAPLEQPSRVAPVEFFTIALLIAKFMDELSLPELSRAIHILRNEVRKQHADIRANSKVFKTMSEIITHQIPSRLVRDTPGSVVTKSFTNNSPQETTHVGKRSPERMEVDSEIGPMTKKYLDTDLRSPSGRIPGKSLPTSPEAVKNPQQIFPPAVMKTNVERIDAVKPDVSRKYDEGRKN